MQTAPPSHLGPELVLGPSRCAAEARRQPGGWECQEEAVGPSG